MRNYLLLTLFYCLCPGSLFSAVYYVAPNGVNTNPGTVNDPFLTIQQAQAAVIPGDTVYVRGGTYMMSVDQVAAYSGIWAYVTLLNKSGTPGKRINYWAYPGEKPVFNYTNIKPPNYRINAFEVTGSWLHIKGLEVVGMQVTITNANTQSICFAANGGSNNIYELLSMHDGMAIGFYLTRGSNNLVLNCDAYRNNDPVSQSGGGVNGGNVDGFGNHPNAGGVNNIFRGCRAWFNSDDGYDCISAHETTTFENCWAFYNGYTPGFVSRADGNGFKAGGYGGGAFTALPVNIPRNTIRFCLAVRNKSNGFYSNHHLEGSDWYNNTAYLNAANYNMLNRKAKTISDYLVDVPGYNHNIKNNISLAPRSANGDITSYDPALNVITNNTFLNPGITVSTNDFLSIDTALLVAPRQPNGDLPVVDFLRLKPTSNLVDKGVNVGFPFNGAAPDLGAFETGGSTLPVQQLSFSSTVAGDNVLLNWKVASEVQNKGWDIERREQSELTWRIIGFVAGRLNAAAMASYAFTDKKVQAGRYHYRLRQVDADGNTGYSNMLLVKIRSNKSIEVAVYPIPVIDNATVKYTLAKAANVNLALYKTSGELVAQVFKGAQQAGSQEQLLSRQLFAAKGSYVVKLSIDGEIITRMITM
ncbi:T9SS type A sorting domain-containing protein [Segetibacter sp. 3557_3]|uniref:right-handed parallel beta-helix repeat-containing protein n=1 Tax=Segetibacter sp. 3557_3 TaxID=2547429 RepID=UPI0010591342|nr:T9SS type A sorting domain-containing protein [Segetibacter sp. 3557_3]TDH20660.1 T9SS type A sorting domain-containing protein [Segetibacter sp. 3557_3]